MTKFNFRILIALLTFSIGISALFLWNFFSTPLQTTIPQEAKSKLKAPIDKIELPETDKEEITFQILRWLGSIESNSKNTKAIYLSPANTSATNLKRFTKIKGIKVLPIPSKDNFLLTNKIKDKSDSKFDYLQFSDFKVKENKVIVSLICYFEGGNSGGNTFEFTKDSGKWKGMIIDTFAAAN